MGGGLLTGIAQLVEHRSPKPRVVGSSPPSCYDELAHKVTWPTMKELTGSAVLVLTASVIIALVVFGMDLAFEQFMSWVYPAR